MNKFLLLCGGAAMCALTATAQTDGVRFVNLGNATVNEARAAARADMAAASQPQLWRAATITNYYWNVIDWDTMTEGWETSGAETFSYNMAGQVTEKSNGYNKAVYEYDAEGRCVRVTNYDFDGTSWIATNIYEYKYDNIVKNLVIDENYQRFENNQWVPGDHYRTVITRNADNNVVKVLSQSNYTWNPGWQDESMMEIGYGADKKANTIKIYGYEDGVQTIEADLVDIVWERTDGQIVDFDLSESATFMGANRILSAKGVKAHTYPYAGDILYSVVYKPNDGGYKMTANMNGALFMSNDYTVLDANGSYTLEEYEIDYDHMDDGTYQPDDPQLNEETKLLDAYGLELQYKEVSYVDGNKANGISYQNETVGTVTYDQTHGYPLEYTTKYSNEGQPFRNSNRTVYSDYYDVIAAGVTDVEVSDEAPVEYYNLQGVRVENPAAGLYIRRQGNRVTKVIL